MRDESPEARSGRRSSGEDPDLPPREDPAAEEASGASQDAPGGGGDEPERRRLPWRLLAVLAVVIALAALTLTMDDLLVRLAGGPGNPEDEPEPPPALEMTEDMREILLFFPADDGAFLRAERAKIFDLRSPAARAKLLLERLGAGPETEGLAQALPEEAQVRNLWISSTGTAYVDFTRQIGRDHPGGTTGELQTIYSVVNSLVYNLPEVHKVQILIEGREVDTLSGHLALWLPLGADLSLVDAESPGTTADRKSTATDRTPPRRRTS